MVGARAIRPVARAKRNIPQIKTRRRPKTSPKRPMGSRKTATERMKRVSTRPTCKALACRFRPIEGRATATADSMKGIKNRAEQTTNSTAPGEILSGDLISQPPGKKRATRGFPACLKNH